MRDLRKDPLADYPLVPISGEAVKAALKSKGLSVTAAAKKIGVSQNSLHYIVTGQTRNCHASLRRDLAKLLKQSQRFLEGKTTILPYAFERLFPVGDWTPIPFVPPHAQLVASDFIVRCIERWERDIKAKTAPPPRGFRKLTTLWNWPPELRREYVGMALYELLEPGRLRRTALASPSGEVPAITSEQRDAAIPGLIAMAEVVLGPWLEGSSPLEYGKAYALIEDVLREAPWFPGTAAEKPSRAAKSARKKHSTSTHRWATP